MDKRAADKLAYEVAKCIERGVIGTRSGPADALLDYLNIGNGEFKSVPQWVEFYEFQLARSDGVLGKSAQMASDKRSGGATEQFDNYAPPMPYDR
jgi:hypothetical protein